MLLPTDLDTAQLDRINVALRLRSRFSARITQAEILDGLNEVIEDVLQGRLSISEGIRDLGQKVRAADYAPRDPRDIGTLSDARTFRRRELMVRTNLQQSRAYGQYRQAISRAVLDAFPAQALVRLRIAQEPRDWLSTWQDAGGTVYPGGRMIARKGDPIWEAISRFGVPFPPFDFNSGMGLEDVDREEAVDLGIIAEDEDVQVEPIDLNDDAQANPAVRDAALREAISADLPQTAWQGNTLVMNTSDIPF